MDKALKLRWELLNEIRMFKKELAIKNKELKKHKKSVSLERLEKEIEREKKEEYWGDILPRRVLDDLLESVKKQASEEK